MKRTHAVRTRCDARCTRCAYLPRCPVPRQGPCPVVVPLPLPCPQARTGLASTLGLEDAAHTKAGGPPTTSLYSSVLPPPFLRGLLPAPDMPTAGPVKRISMPTPTPARLLFRTNRPSSAQGTAPADTENAFPAAPVARSLGNPPNLWSFLDSTLLCSPGGLGLGFTI